MEKMEECQDRIEAFIRDIDRNVVNGSGPLVLGYKTREGTYCIYSGGYGADLIALFDAVIKKAFAQLPPEFHGLMAKKLCDTIGNALIGNIDQGLCEEMASSLAEHIKN